MIRMRPLSALRLGAELVLVTFTLWLVVQNAALLMTSWSGAPREIVVIGTLLRAILSVLVALWPWTAFSLALAAAIAAGLISNSIRGVEEREARHA
jgi:type IV secretory pathway TrbD component